MSLTQDLAREHTRMLSSLQAVRDEGAADSDGRARLADARMLLEAHLEREEEDIYGALEAAAAGDPGVRMTLSLYGRNVETLTGEVMAFFDKYAAATPYSEADFSRDFDKMLHALKARIQHEEAILFREYDRVTVSVEA